MVNFHGSSSFGQAFVESILGAPGDKPFQDVMAATDFLIAEGSVDPKRMAAAGGSYGGYLVNWIAGQTDRFAALVSHAGVYSLLGQFGSDVTYGPAALVRRVPVHRTSRTSSAGPRTATRRT